MARTSQSIYWSGCEPISHEIIHRRVFTLSIWVWYLHWQFRTMIIHRQKIYVPPLHRFACDHISSALLVASLPRIKVKYQQATDILKYIFRQLGSGISHLYRLLYGTNYRYGDRTDWSDTGLKYKYFLHFSYPWHLFYWKKWLLGKYLTIFLINYAR